MEFRAAERFIARCRVSTAALTERAFASLSAETGGLAACGLLMASARPLPDLRGILASHALIHTAEGAFYRQAIAAVCERRNIELVQVSERGIAEVAGRLPGSDADRRARLKQFGMAVGRPWTADEKLSATAAWLALASRPSRGSSSRGDVSACGTPAIPPSSASSRGRVRRR